MSGEILTLVSIGFVVGLFSGGIAATFVWCLVIAAGLEDEDLVERNGKIQWMKRND